MWLDTVDKMLDNFLIHLIAQSLIALEDAAHGLSFQQLSMKKMS